MNDKNVGSLIVELRKDIEYLGKNTENNFLDLKQEMQVMKNCLFGENMTGGLVSEVSKIKENQSRLSSIQAGFTTIVGIIVLLSQKYLKW